MGQKMKSAICLPHEFSDVFNSLTDEQAGQLIKAIFYYDITGEQTNLDDGVLQFAWASHIKPKMDKIAENYNKKCQINRENVAKRWAQDTNERKRTNTTVKAVSHKYGTYSNVLLTDDQLDKLKAEFPNDYAERIDRVSEYCKQNGRSYKDYLATIRNWARRDAERKSNVIPLKNDVNAGYNQALSILGLKNG
jgi:hypothetical protein